MTDVVVLGERMHAIRERMRLAEARAGRTTGSARLIAVSKLHPAGSVRAAWQAGQRDFGENYAQELRDKVAALMDCAGLTWHAIGPVQTRNAKYLARAATVFHALFDEEIARELARRRTGPPLRCLVQVNVADEDSKSGLAPGALGDFLQTVRGLPGLEVVGLSTMPPLVEVPEHNRAHFQALADLARGHGLPELSMGTTADFEVAIEEGATWVRVGTAIFGDRPAR